MSFQSHFPVVENVELDGTALPIEFVGVATYLKVTNTGEGQLSLLLNDQETPILIDADKSVEFPPGALRITVIELDGTSSAQIIAGVNAA
jgi:hypothetical protein